jgi:hypothetical protein
MKCTSSLLLALLLSFSAAHGATLAGSHDTTTFVNAGQNNTLSGERWVCEDMVATQTGTATSVAVYVNDDHDDHAKIILTNSAGTVLATSGVLVLSAGTGTWLIASSLSVAITSGQTYYGCVSTDGGADGRIGLMDDGVAGNFVADDGTYTSPPSSLALEEDGGNSDSLWYIDGTTGGGGTTVVNPISGKGGAAARPVISN